MSEHSSNGMLAENPLELEMVFSEGVFIADGDVKLNDGAKPEEGKETETVEREAKNQMVPVSEPKIEPETPVQEAVNVPEENAIKKELNAIPVKEAAVEIVSENTEKPAVIALSKPVRVLINFQNGLFNGEDQTRELVKKFFSIITKNGKVLDENFYEIVDVRGSANPPKNILLKGALKMIVFGTVNNEVCEGLRQYEVRMVEGIAVAQFPALSEVMADSESKQKFALALKKYFGQ